MADSWFLKLENFKSIKRMERLEGRPITLLLGSNNAGKTSVLQALLLLAGSQANPEAVLTFRNDLVDLGSFSDTVTKQHESEGIAFTIDGEGTGGSWHFFLRVDTKEGTLQIRECGWDGEDAGKAGTLHFHYLRSPFAEEPPKTEYHREQKGQETVSIAGRDLLEKLRWWGFYPELTFYSRVLFGLYHFPRRFFNSMRYIGPLRVYPERSYPFQPPPVPDVGIDGHWAPYLLHEAKEKPLQDLRYWLGPERFGLVQDLRARDVEELPHFVVEVNIRGQWINLHDVGFGMSQLLPIVVESILMPAMSRPDPPLLLLEQPEIHLHPKAQSDLGTFVAEMSRQGRRYLIETHSEYLLMRLATEVRRGTIAADDVAIYFLSLDEEGYTQFRRIRLADDGRLPPPAEWPKGFFDTDIDEADAFLFTTPKQAVKE
jgi:predicted ATPase